MSYAARFPAWRDEERALLTWGDLDVVRALVAETAPRWSAELNQASHDEATIVVMPEAANDLIGPSFVLHRTKGRVHLDQLRWDTYRELGCFATLDEALGALRTRLAAPESSGAADVDRTE
jgi:hypothetical protein